MSFVTMRNGLKLSIEQLSMQDLNELNQLQKKVLNHLPDKSFLQPLTEEEFKYILDGNGLLVGIRSEGSLIAFRALLDPNDDPEHLGRDAGIPENEWSKVLYSEITTVDPEFQGNNIQRQLGKFVMNTVDRNRYHYICATVSPFNIASIKDKFDLGMHVAALTTKYGTLIRYVMVKKLSECDVFQEIKTANVPVQEIELQQKLLNEGWVGTSLIQKEDEWFILYQKKDV